MYDLKKIWNRLYKFNRLVEKVDELLVKQKNFSVDYKKCLSEN